MSDDTLDKAQNGDLRIEMWDDFPVCADDKRVLMIEEVPQWPMFLQWRCPECGKIKLHESH